MLHLKTFEGLLYGEKFFGKDVFSYFPWMKYPRDIDTLPTLIEEKQFTNFYLGSLSGTIYEPMTYRWITSDLSMICNLTSLKSNSIRTIILKPNEEIVDIVDIDHKEYSVDDWADVEKLRLMYLLGTKKKAIEYLNVLDELEFYYDFYLYEIENGNSDESIGVISSHSLIQKFDFSHKSRISNNLIDDKKITEFIRNYKGSNSFLLSLQSYLSSRGNLTQRQIDSVRIQAALYPILNDVNKICFYFVDGDINSPSVRRMVSGGCKVLVVDGVVVLWKE